MCYIGFTCKVWFWIGMLDGSESDTWLATQTSSFVPLNPTTQYKSAHIFVHWSECPFIILLQIVEMFPYRHIFSMYKICFFKGKILGFSDTDCFLSTSLIFSSCSLLKHEQVLPQDTLFLVTGNRKSCFLNDKSLSLV